MADGTGEDRKSGLSLRSEIQNGYGRGVLTVVVPVLIGAVAYTWWPSDPKVQEKILNGLQKIAFVSAAFGVTAYNLRTRVVDLVLKIDGTPTRVEEFCRIARNCGQRLTNLVILFTFTSLWLGALSIPKEGTIWSVLAAVGAISLFSASSFSFIYVIFSFERLERFALDEAEANARAKEAKRLFPEK